MSTKRGPPNRGGVCHVGVGWGGSCTGGVGWVMYRWGCVMQGWCGVGHVGVVWSCRGGVGCVMQGWGGVQFTFNIL